MKSKSAKKAALKPKLKRLIFYCVVVTISRISGFQNPKHFLFVLLGRTWSPREWKLHLPDWTLGALVFYFITAADECVNTWPFSFFEEFIPSKAAMNARHKPRSFCFPQVLSLSVAWSWKSLQDMPAQSNWKGKNTPMQSEKAIRRHKNIMNIYKPKGKFKTH